MQGWWSSRNVVEKHWMKEIIRLDLGHNFQIWVNYPFLFQFMNPLVASLDSNMSNVCTLNNVASISMFFRKAGLNTIPNGSLISCKKKTAAFQSNFRHLFANFPKHFQSWWNPTLSLLHVYTHTTICPAMQMWCHNSDLHCVVVFKWLVYSI